MINFKHRTYSEDEGLDKSAFLSFLTDLNGYTIKCKILHWAAPKNDIHARLDEFYEILAEYSDAFAEGFMGILGKFGPRDVGCSVSSATSAMELVSDIEERVTDFYDSLPDDVKFKGINSDLDSFIQDIQKYKYLFSLCV